MENVFNFEVFPKSTWDKKFILSFRQHKYSDRDNRDKAKRCSNYPTAEYTSFAECDSAFLWSKCQAHGILPFWATDNMSEVSSSAGDLRQLAGQLRALYEGSLESDCPPPCRSVRGQPRV